MGFQEPHDRNCPAVWRGFYVTLFDRIPEDAPCTCGTEAGAAARDRAGSVEMTKRAA